MATYKPTAGAQALAADLARRGGPKHPSMAERKATVERLQKRPPVPMKVSDKQMIAGGGRPLQRPASPGQSPLPRPGQAPMSGPPGSMPGMPGRFNSPSSMSGGSFPPGPSPMPNRTFLPTFPVGGGGQQSPRPPMGGPPSNFQSGGSFPSGPPARPQGGNTQAAKNLIDILRALMGGGQDGEWGESSQRATTDPITWDVSPWGR